MELEVGPKEPDSENGCGEEIQGDEKFQLPGVVPLDKAVSIDGVIEDSSKDSEQSSSDLCIFPNCQNVRKYNNSGYCNECCHRSDLGNKAELESDVFPVTCRPPGESSPDQIMRRCVAGCQNYGNKDKGYLCNQCFTQRQSIVKNRCHTSGCVNFKNPDNQHNMCNACYSRLSSQHGNSQSPETSQPSLPKVLCKTPGCNQYKMPHHDMCTECCAKFCGNPDMMISAEITSAKFICRGEGCTNYGDAKRQNLCNACFSSRSSFESSATDKIESPFRDLNFDKDDKCHVPGCIRIGWKDLGGMCEECHEGYCVCVTPGCQNIGVPEAKNMCYSCYNKTKFELGRTQTSFAKCINPHCNLWGSKDIEGYCTKCFISLRYKTTSREENLKSCIVENCEFYGSSEFGGRCSQCFSRSTQSGVSHKYQSLPVAQIVKTPSENRKCHTPGCEFFGLPEHNNLCSKCLKEYIKKDSKLTLKTTGTVETGGNLYWLQSMPEEHSGQSPFEPWLGIENTPKVPGNMPEANLADWMNTSNSTDHEGQQLYPSVVVSSLEDSQQPVYPQPKYGSPVTPSLGRFHISMPGISPEWNISPNKTVETKNSSLYSKQRFSPEETKVRLENQNSASTAFLNSESLASFWYSSPQQNSDHRSSVMQTEEAVDCRSPVMQMKVESLATTKYSNLIVPDISSQSVSQTRHRTEPLEGVTPGDNERASVQKHGGHQLSTSRHERSFSDGGSATGQKYRAAVDLQKHDGINSQTPNHIPTLRAFSPKLPLSHDAESHPQQKKSPIQDNKSSDKRSSDSVQRCLSAPDASYFVQLDTLCKRSCGRCCVLGTYPFCVECFNILHGIDLKPVPPHTFETSELPTHIVPAQPARSISVPAFAADSQNVCANSCGSLCSPETVPYCCECFKILKKFQADKKGRDMLQEECGNQCGRLCSTNTQPYCEHCCRSHTNNSHSGDWIKHQRRGLPLDHVDTVPNTRTVDNHMLEIPSTKQPGTGKVKLRVMTTSLDRIKTDALICIWSKENLEAGLISHSVIKETGEGIIKDWESFKRNLMCNHCICTEGGHINTRKIFHVLCTHLTDRAVKMVLKTCVETAKAGPSVFSTVVIPLSLCDVLSQSIEVTARGCLLLIKDLQIQSSNQNLPQYVFVVVSDKKTENLFKAEIVRVQARSYQESQRKWSESVCRACRKNPTAKLRTVSKSCHEGCRWYCVSCLKQHHRGNLSCPSHGPCMPPIGHKNTFALLVAGQDPKPAAAKIFIKDTNLMREVLKDQDIVGIRDENLIVVTSKTPGVEEDLKTVVIRAFKELREKMAGKDNVYFFLFFSGHNSHESLRLGGSKNRITPRELKRELRQLDAEQIIAVMDCCYSAGTELTEIDEENFMSSLGDIAKTDSGSFILIPKLWNLYSNDDDDDDDYLGAKNERTKVKQWASSVAEEQSFFNKLEKQSLFTHCITRILMNVCPERNEHCGFCRNFHQKAAEDECIYLENIHQCVEAHVIEQAKRLKREQHPQLYGNHGDDVAFAYYLGTSSL